MIFLATARSWTFPLPKGRALAEHCLCNLTVCGAERQNRALASSLPPETYETLTSSRPIRNRKLTRVGAKDPAAKELLMLDVAFVVLGLAVLALMGAYAVGLRQL